MSWYFVTGIDNTYLPYSYHAYRPEADQYIYTGVIGTTLRKNSDEEYQQFARDVILAFDHPQFDGYPHLPPDADISEVSSYSGEKQLI